ncbi:MAG: hypothetical protein JSV01_09525 [Desulfobacterales bacterium]|nr:MAG: hypothetical protein JSV01_09525 [Desulfobacterales bacterium]
MGTSTGFASADTSAWPPFSLLIMIFFTLQCGCAGSTTGGMKVDRMVMFWKLIRNMRNFLFWHFLKIITAI